MMKHTIRHGLKLIGLLVVSSLLTGCMDLGFENIETLYDTFDDDVTFIYTNAHGIGYTRSHLKMMSSMMTL